MKHILLAFAVIASLTLEASALQVKPAADCSAQLAADLNKCESEKTEDLIKNIDDYEACNHACLDSVCRHNCSEDMHYRGYLIEEFEFLYCTQDAYGKFGMCQPRVFMRQYDNRLKTPVQ